MGGIAETNGRPCVCHVLKGICRAVYCDAYQQGKVCLITAARLLGANSEYTAANFVLNVLLP